MFGCCSSKLTGGDVVNVAFFEPGGEAAATTVSVGKKKQKQKQKKGGKDILVTFDELKLILCSAAAKDFTPSPTTNKMSLRVMVATLTDRMKTGNLVASAAETLANQPTAGGG